MQRANRAAIFFSVSWKSPFAQHSDNHFIDKADFWRDLFPGDMGRILSAMKPGEKCQQRFEAGTLVPPFSEKHFVKLAPTDLVDNNNQIITPKLGRFYPKGMAWKAFNSFPQNTEPFRITSYREGTITADANHPLARFPLTLEAQLVEKRDPAEEHGGSCNDIGEIITVAGPGMQIAAPGTVTDFYSPYPFHRKNDADDSSFYDTARMVNHLDDTAIAGLTSLYARLLQPRSRVLDLMSSWQSHLPESLENTEVTGLGLNYEELQANRRLARTIVHDLNSNPVLPFPENEFDACICAVSMEYLTQPLEVMAEIARVTRPGGLFVAIISDRWFPGKEILPWGDMHPFERFGLVLDYFLRTPALEDVHTESVVGLPRPLSDRHFGKTVLSDPLFAVWGTVNRRD